MIVLKIKNGKDLKIKNGKDLKRLDDYNKITSRQKKKPKYGNKKRVYDGMEFDSKAEIKRYSELKLLERAGQIHDLDRQVKFILIDTQRDEEGKLIERECSYIADFTYRDKSDEFIVEDVKGYRDGAGYALFVIKRKLMLERYGIKVREITR